MHTSEGDIPQGFQLLQSILDFRCPGVEFTLRPIKNAIKVFSFEYKPSVEYFKPDYSIRSYLFIIR